jgi:hypothetical protein
MRDPIDAAADPDSAPTRAEPRRSISLIHLAPAPEEPDVRDKAGRQRGMAIALIGAGAFWAAVGAAAYFLRR